MSRRSSLTWLLTVFFLLMGIKGTEAAPAQTPAPSPWGQPVRLPAGWTTLAQALAEASRQSGISISYSSTRIAATHRLYLPPGPAQPLGTVLSDLLGPRRVAYGLLDGQVVLWPAQLAAPPGVTHVNEREPPLTGLAGAAAARPEPEPSRLAKGTRPAGTSSSGLMPHAITVPSKGQKTKVVGTPITSRTTQPPARRGSSATRRYPPASAGDAARRAAAQRSRRAGRGTAVAALPARLVQAAGPRPALPRTLPLVAWPGPDPVAPDHYQDWQLGLVYPLSTNGRANARLTNGFSVNGLVGYAAGVRKVEVGGLANLVRDTVRGMQVAGLLNLTGAAVRGVQLAYPGANWSGGSLRGVQGALLFNAVRDDARGLQVALFNVVGGKAPRAGPPSRLRRWLAGAHRLATDTAAQSGITTPVKAPGLLLQVAAVANIAGQEMHGVQAANGLNVANRITGVQFGYVNIAHHVRGLQLGLLNIADSVDGVSLGLLNLVRHGYNHGEVWVSETMPLNLALKFGVRHYYTILSAAANPIGDHLQWAAGFGVGTAGRPHGRWTPSLDVITWNVFPNPEDDVSVQLLTQLRPTVAWQIEKAGHLQLVLVPTLNWATAQGYYFHAPQYWRFGRDRWLLVNETGSTWSTRVWLGFQVGLRF